MSPAGRVGDEADDEEHPGEGLHGAADGEDGAADAAPAADGQQREQVSDQLKKNHIGGFQRFQLCCSSNVSPITHHESESEDEGNDGAPPGVRVLVLVEVGEERLEVVGVGDALALEELLARGLRAMEEEANGVRWQLKDKQFMLRDHT